MSRWLAELRGDPYDTEEFLRWFPRGDIHAIEENGSVFLTGAAFVGLSAAHVHDRALQAIDEFSSAIMLLVPDIDRPSIGSVIFEADDGSRQQHAFVSGVGVLRLKGSGSLTVVGQDPDPDALTKAQILLNGSRTGSHLGMALSLWGDAPRTWPRLYRVLEEVEQHLGCRVDQAGLTSRAERTRFTQSANVAEVAGRDSRHATGRFESPGNPMSLDEAGRFVGGLLREVLRLAGTV